MQVDRPTQMDIRLLPLEEMEKEIAAEIIQSISRSVHWGDSYSNQIIQQMDHYGDTCTLVTLSGKVIWAYASRGIPPIKTRAYCDKYLFEYSPGNNMLADKVTPHKMNNAGCKFLFAILHEQIIGYIAYTNIQADSHKSHIGTYHITSIAVDANNQDKNVGATLIKKVIDIVKEQGFQTLTLDYNASKPKNASFYTQKIPGLCGISYSEKFDGYRIEEDDPGAYNYLTYYFDPNKGKMEQIWEDGMRSVLQNPPINDITE